MIRKNAGRFSLYMGYFIFSYLTAHTQKNETNGWFVIFNKKKLAQRFNLLTDIQFRSTEKVEHLATLLLRTAVSYQINKKHSGALGYVYVGDWAEKAGERENDFENRIFEQYMVELKSNKKEFIGRFRLEQRFTGQRQITQFSQRSRVMVNAMLPLANGVTFKKGPYILIQDEIFVNVQHKQRTNNRFFDQNRLYGGLGYKYSSTVKSEFGYMFRRKQNEQDYINNHIFQITLSTSF
ncbi:MAG: DUF2490 domain-containing protein [Chitinophagaceae bacterium]